jgi:amino acid transporter
MSGDISSSLYTAYTVVSPILNYVIAFLIATFFYFLSQRSLSKRENKEYNQHVELARHDILVAIRPSISENQLPTKETLVSLISSISQKYHVLVDSVFTINSLVDELIREVMESPFISSATKNQYCQNLAGLKETIPASTGEIHIPFQTSMNTTIGFLLTLIISMITFFMLLISTTELQSLTSIMFIISLLTLIVGTYFIVFIINKKYKRP